MALYEYVEYLSKDIGARPAGTDEEQEAALYITEQFQKDTGFSATIEEFTCSANVEGVRGIFCAVTVVVAILAMFFSVLVVPAFIIALLMAVLYTLEVLDRPLVSRVFAKRPSQNVIAKYQPNTNEETDRKGRSRSRKIVLVAQYDSGKVTPALVKRAQSLGFPWAPIYVGGMAAVALLLLIRIPIADVGGIGIVVLNVLTILAVLVCLFPVVKTVLYRLDKFSPYSEGANNNATGTAALIETARRISRGSVSEADLAANPELGNVVIHGEDAALESGLVPEGAQIRYEAERLIPPEEIGSYTEEERLLAAKAAIAALTGQPIEKHVYGSAATQLVGTRAHDPLPSEQEQAHMPAAIAEEPGDLPVEAMVEAPAMQGPADVDAAQMLQAQQQAAAPAPVETAPVVSDAVPTPSDSFENAPSWFVAAQEKAKRSGKSSTGYVQRSRYATAIEAAEREAAERERQREEEERAKREEELCAREEKARAALEAKAAERAAAQAMVPEPKQQAEAPELKPVEPVEGAAATEAVAVPAVNLLSNDFVEQPAAEPNATVGFKPISTEDLKQELQRELQQEAIAAVPEIEAEQDKASKTADAPLSAALPSIDAKPAVPETSSPSRSGLLRKLRTDVPSMSGVIRMQEAGEDVSQDADELAAIRKAAREEAERERAAQEAAEEKAVELAQQIEAKDAQAASMQDAKQGEGFDASLASETIAMPPYRPLSLHDLDFDLTLDDDLYAPEKSEGHTRETDLRTPVSGAIYTPEETAEAPVNREPVRPTVNSVDIPASRAGGIFGRFRNKKRDDLQETPQEWLDVDDNFEARSVGKARGSWESFREDAPAPADRADGYDDFDEYGDFDEYEDRPTRSNRKWQGGAVSRRQLGYVNTESEADGEADTPLETIEDAEGQLIAEEIEQIYHFRNPYYNTEIWFVALGADTELHDGAKAFLAEHADELRGSMIIEVEALGLGDLSVVTAEGAFRKVAASSRVKRFTRSATAATGITLGNVNLSGTDSAASLAQKAGFQAMHLVGVENGEPALKGDLDDIVENLDENLLEENVNFLMEVLKS